MFVDLLYAARNMQITFGNNSSNQWTHLKLSCALDSLPSSEASCDIPNIWIKTVQIEDVVIPKRKSTLLNSLVCNELLECTSERFEFRCSIQLFPERMILLSRCLER